MKKLLNLSFIAVLLAAAVLSSAGDAGAQSSITAIKQNLATSEISLDARQKAPAEAAAIKTGAVTGHGVKVRKGPSTNEKAIHDVLYGSRLQILEEKNGFLKAKFEDGTTGWISKQFVTTTDKNLLGETVYSKEALEAAYESFKTTYAAYTKLRNKASYDEFKKAYLTYRNLAKLSPEYKTLQQNPALTKIIVDKKTYTLTVYLNDKPVRAYPIAYGGNPDGKNKQAQGDSRTPEGNFKIGYKDVRAYDPVATRGMWLETKWSGIGIHGTPWPDSIGSKASHGCVRMYSQDSIELYKLVRAGTPVTIKAINPSGI